MPRHKGAALSDYLPWNIAKRREEEARAAEAEKVRLAKAANPYGTPVYNTAPRESTPTSTGSSAYYTGRPAWSLGGRKTTKIGRKFDRCVKAVRKTVRARKGSSKESAAIAICTKSVLQTRGRTLKRYKKGRLTTQKRFRGGTKEALVQIADDLDKQIPSITNAFGTNQPMQYTHTVGQDVIAAALAAAPVTEAPTGLFGRVRKAVSSKPPADKVREFLEELSTKGSYTFSDIVEPASMSEHLRALAA